MGLVLFMTVGTGVGENKDLKIKNLAHGLLASIKHYRPEKCVFFGSEESKDTVFELEKQYRTTPNGILKYHFVTLSGSDIDRFDACFEKIENKIAEYSDNDIVIDYTSGTKTMTMSAAICSVLHHRKLSLVSGKRGPNGIVISGSENVLEQNLYSAYDNMLFNRFKEQFNTYRFDEAIHTLDQIVVLDEKDKYCNMASAYSDWDKFRHNDTLEKLKTIKDENLSRNKFLLGTLINNEKLRPQLLLADLINNSERRIEESKYDDALARLYRAIELIAQIKLKEYGFNELDDDEKVNFNLTRIKEKGVDINKYDKYADDNGKLRLGLEKKFELLNDLGWTEAKTIYLKNKILKNILTQRNESILAHGLKSVERETAEKLLKEVKRYAKLVISDIENKMNDAKFPKL